MNDARRGSHLTDPGFLRNHGLTRRDALKFGAAGGGAALLGGISMTGYSAPHLAAQEEITGGPIEVGVLQEDPHPWFKHAQAIGDSLEADFPGTEVKYTFANTASDSARALRWQNGDPLDVDTGRWSNQAPPTWDWPNNGFILDLTPYTEETTESGEIWADTFTESARSFAIDTRADSETPGAWWGIPYEMTLMLMHYNVTAFEELGLTPPTTWAEFLDVCAAIDAVSGDTGMKPVCVSGPTDVYCGHWWDRMTQRIVGREGVEAVVYGDARVADDPGFLLAAQEIAKLPENGWFMEGFEGADFTTAQALFFQGKAAMIHMGTWLSSEMKDVIPEDYHMGVFDFPQYEGGAGNQSAMFGTAAIWSVANPEKSTSHEVNVPLAVEYVRRWTDPETQERGASEWSFIPSVKGVAPPTSPAGLDVAVEQSAENETIIYYYGIHWDTALWAAWYQPVQALFLGATTPEGMIEMIDANMDEYRQVRDAGA
ncbi:MAG: extracellular solute-binding protein [Thermomicrobiales bacterium]|nr:extracellular solute-binding protein [Thermomicrobiales bacterium]